MSKFQKRKKRFWAVCLVIMLVLVQSVPMSVAGADYTITYNNGNYEINTTVLKYRDGINFVINKEYVFSLLIDYCDLDGTHLMYNEVMAEESGDLSLSYGIESYSYALDGASGQMPVEQFKEWKVTSIDGSGGYPNEIVLQAVAYTKSNITYNLNGGSNPVSNPNIYYEGKEVITLADATKDGYTFDGWYKDAEFTTKVTSIPTTQTGDITLYAKFLKNYKITYDLNGGTNGDNPGTYASGIGVDSFADASKEGCTFAGWYTDETFSVKVTSISANQTGDITLYAKFTPNKYNITYELDGGTNGAGNPPTYTYGEGVASFADASKTGHTFDGWYSGDDELEEVTSITDTQTGDITLYAMYTPNRYEINYELNGGTNGVGNPTTYTYGEGVTSFANASKTGYTFDGWYSDAAFTTKVTSISRTRLGKVTLYAKFVKNAYGITYVMNGGTNPPSNPLSYTYGDGVASFANASKIGHTFIGWYSDAAFTTPVTSISATQMGAVTLYARFKVNQYDINYVLNGGTNGAGNPTSYTYGEGVTSFKDASKEGYTFDGWYSDAQFTKKVTSISTTQTGTVTLYAKFKIMMKQGVGSITVKDVYYGEKISPVVESTTNGTEQVTITYKKKGDADSSYTTTVPVAVGEYTACATFAETEEYYEVIATDDFSIEYLGTPESPYEIKGTMGNNGYYTSVVSVTPKEGYVISTAIDGNYQNKIDVDSSTSGFSVYLKKADTGAMTGAVEVPAIKIDKDAPVILNAESGSTVYGDEVEVTVKDEHLNKVLVNNEAVKLENGKTVLKLSSNYGEEEYTISCEDEAGNKSESHIVVAAEWMKSKTIPTGKVRLFSKYAYRLGGGSWRVNGDNTTYSGNITFYVGSDGDYNFSNAN